MSITSAQDKNHLVKLLRASGSRLKPPIDLDAPLPEAGQTLDGRFRVGRFLGSGGMGLVFHGEDLETDGEIVIKTLRPGCSLEEVQRFVQEASLPLPSHPHVVQTVAHFVHAGRPYHVQEFVDGRNLAEIHHARQEHRSAQHAVEAGWFDSTQAPRVAVCAIADVADALKALHEQGITHRDLKPANLVWSEQGKAVLIDFGLALRNQHNSLSRPGRVVGTGAYMAPEQLRGKVADARADIYSLAVTLWQLLTGYIPTAMPQCGVLFGSGKPIEQRLMRILQTALEPNPRFRFQSAGQFAAALQSWLLDEPSGFAQGSSVSIRRWLYFRRFELALGTSAVAVFAAVLLGWMFFRFQVRAETTRQGTLAADAAAAHSKQEAFFGGESEDDLVFIHETLASYSALVKSGVTHHEQAVRNARRDALELIFRSGDFEQADTFLATRVGIEWADFEDACLDAGVHSGLGRYDQAIEVLDQASELFPKRKELIRSAITTLEAVAAAVEVDIQPQGQFVDAGGSVIPITIREGAVHAVRVTQGGSHTLEALTPSGAFPVGSVYAGCSVSGPNGELGRMFYLDDRSCGEVVQSNGSGIYWQASGSSTPPILVRENNPNIGLSCGLGLYPIDLDNDGVDEVLVPFSNTDAQSFLFKLVDGTWERRGLPGKGGDVHSLRVFRRGESWQMVLATAQWNDARQGLKVRTFDLSPTLATMTHGLDLPVGAIASWNELQGWPAHSVAVFGWMDEAQFFGKDYRHARNGEVWLFGADDERGLFPLKRIGGTPPPRSLSDTTGAAFALDLDADGRDEICWVRNWKGVACVTMILADSEGVCISLPVAIRVGGTPMRFQSTDGTPGIIFPGAGGAFPASYVLGVSGERENQQALPLRSSAERILSVRGEGPAWEGNFTIPSEWRLGEDAVWFEGQLKMVSSDFDSMVFLHLERDGEGGPISPEWSLGLRTIGGGNVYFHRLGPIAANGMKPDALPPTQPLPVIPGGWVAVRIGPSATGSEMTCTLTPDVGTPGNPTGIDFPIPLQPISGATVKWDWRPPPPSFAGENRDETAVMAFDWLGGGAAPPAGFARSDAIKATVALRDAILAALEAEDRIAFEAAKAKLKEMVAPPRSAIDSADAQNCLARYYLEEYGDLFLGE